MIKKILKFGGSSVGTPEMIHKASEIVINASKNKDVAVVVSAFQGITDQLLKSSKLAVVGDVNFKNEVELIKNRHIEAVKKLIRSKKDQKRSLEYIEKLIKELSLVLERVYLKKEVLSKELDLIVSFGERLSAFIVSGHIQDGFSKKSYFVDAREIVKTDDNFINAVVDFNSTNKAIKNYFKGRSGIPVITGFLGSTKNNKTTTLGRGGSDYSAAIFGAALGVRIVEIWTDVDGILSADPKLVKNAVVLDEVSYEEAVELAYFGAKVIHPATMLPAVKEGIPIVIKNTFNPVAKGTLVLKDPAKNTSPVRGITSIDDISLVIVGGVSLIGIPGSAARVFDATRRAKANVILISQASSEHTICLAIKTNELESALDSLNNEFEKEIKNKAVSLNFISNQAIIAMVGDEMRGTPGISGRLFKVLGDNKINITAIAQGGSERNISLTVDSRDKVRALNLIHDQFVFGGVKNIFLVGTGNIGGTLLDQIRGLESKFLRVCGIINDKKMFLSEIGMDLKNWKKLLEQEKEASFDNWISDAGKINFSNKIFVDCTASESISKKYIEIVESGFNIVTPNKKFNVLSMKDYLKMRCVLKENNKKFLYETNVGAALPIISTIKDLIATGDKVEKIEGIFSGTLSFIFNNFNSKENFSEIVAKAKKLGYTEPDPREDLSGQDVGRKLLILAREMGLEMDLKDVKIESLVPEKLKKIKDVEKFMIELKKFDTYFRKLSEKAEKQNKVLRYVAKIEKSRASAKLEMISKENPLAHTSGADNIFAFYTKRYKVRPGCAGRPLVVQGPGAGAEVTAGGVLADILKI
ncbi:MAG: bifunctional aspartate kinase/homoserine dehydrogenase I [Minisyncoccota bacterium]